MTAFNCFSLFSYLLLILLNNNTTRYTYDTHSHDKLHIKINSCNLLPPTHNSCHPTTTCGLCMNSVVYGNAVDRASWGKSGCECKCCFPNTRGLHCRTGDAPLETHYLPGPSWCHVHNSNSPSSRRIQVVAVAYRHKRHESTKRSITHRRDMNANNICSKQFHLLKDVKICNDDAPSKKANLD